MHILQIPSNEVKPHVTLLYLGGDLTDESAAKRANLNLREFQHAKEAMILDDWRVFYVPFMFHKSVFSSQQL